MYVLGVNFFFIGDKRRIVGQNWGLEWRGFAKKKVECHVAYILNKAKIKKIWYVDHFPFWEMLNSWTFPVNSFIFED